MLGLSVSGLFFLYRKKGKRIRTIYLLTALLLLFGLLLLYKPASSLGRVFIYRTSCKMFTDNWCKGVGLGRFKARYNEYQANYFSENDINGKTALLADNTFYAFNDYLQWGIETGIGGIVILILFILLLYHRVKRLLLQKGRPRIILGAAAGLICIGTASLFSYPMQVWPIQLLALVYTGIILFYPSTGYKLWQKVTTWSGRLLFLCLSILLATGILNTIKRNKLEREAFRLSQAGYKQKAIAAYRQLSGQWPVYGYNTQLLAEQLYYTNQLPEALPALQQSKSYYADNKTYLLQAKIYTELKNLSTAEQCYLRAVHMVPNRMGSRFELMNFYITQQDTANAVEWAKSIISMPVKVPSEKTAMMLEQANEVLKRMTVN